MTVRRVFIPLEESAPRWIDFPAEAARYVRTVLRLKPGDEVEVFDGKQEYLVRLSRSDREGVCGEVMATRPPRHQEPLIVLAFGCVRPGPFQEILRHGTELGVSRFVPILSRRTSRRPEEGKSRWRSVVASAAAQSGRTGLPVVESPVSFTSFVTSVQESSAKFILSPASTVPDLFSDLCSEGRSPLVLLVGPEGGFEPSEEAQAVSAGFRPVRLGRGVLRTETAAMGAVAVAVSWWEVPTTIHDRSAEAPCGHSIDPG